MFIDQEGHWSAFVKHVVFEGYIQCSSQRTVQIHLQLIAYGDEEYGNVTT